MDKEIYLYGGVYSFGVESLIASINELTTEKLTLRINSDGGNPQDIFGLVRKWQEYQGEKMVAVDGRANSTLFFFLAYCDNCEALDVSQFVLHRAAYGGGYEEYMTESDKQSLITINADLRKAIEAKINIPEFEKITGKNLDDVFSLDSRIDVSITAEQAKKIGLINRVVKITPKKQQAIASVFKDLNAQYVPIIAAESNEELPIINTKMTYEEVKTKHPEVFASIRAEGVTAERDRVGSFLTFMQIDPVAATAGIKGFEAITQTQISEFALAGFAKNQLTATTEESAKTVETKEVETPVVEAEAKKAEFLASVRNELGLTDKK